MSISVRNPATETSRENKYRPEIDGLRAIAVLGVALFHAGFKSLSGGYTGVDVFFVISGFLITRFIDERISTGTFSIAEFYERRIRRIIPALVAVCLFTVLVGYFLLLPLDYKDYGASLLATTTFLSNVFFWHKAGYFAAASSTEPLLHTWSLAVEEQFYIFFPLFMLLVARFSNHLKRPIIVTVLLGSFLLSIISVTRWPVSAFFLPFDRAWEFLIGSALAIGLVPRVAHSHTRAAASSLGLLLIAFGFIVYTPSTPFPGIAALAPCLGTALIIWAEEHRLTLIGKALKVKPLAWIGLISYSLYLWHWPIIAFARYVLQRPFTPLDIGVIMMSSILAAALSWKYIEQPFRGRRAPFSRRKLFGVTALIGAALSCIALLIYLGQGLPYRVNVQAQAYDKGALQFSPRGWACLPSRTRKPHYCKIGVPGRPQFIVWGDSHAAAMLPAFQRAARKLGLSGILAAQSACAPLLGVHRTDDPHALCAQFNQQVLDDIRSRHIRTVFLVARWGIDALGITPYEALNADPQTFIEDAQTKNPSLAENKVVFAHGFSRTLNALRGLKVYVMLDVPNPDVSVPTYLARKANAGLIGARFRIKPNTISRAHRMHALLRTLSARNGALVLNPWPLLCRANRCLIAAKGHALYMDNQHVSLFGARLLTPLVFKALEQVLTVLLLNTTAFQTR